METYYYFQDQTQHTPPLDEVGGKAKALIETTQPGFPVPFFPKQGFGFQRVDNMNVDETYLIQHQDAIILDQGYHPVVAAGGYSLYYL